MNESSSISCIIMVWSYDTIESIQSIFYTCLLGLLIHLIFWIQLICYSSLRERNLMWLYAYLIVDFFLLSRFFLFYGLRRNTICVLTSLRNLLCYFEATFLIYLNLIQSYILLALNISRFMQIRFNRNVYLRNRRILIIIHLLIYIIPLFIIYLQIIIKFSLVWKKEGGSCDLIYQSIWIQFFNIIIGYIIPIILNIIFLSMSHIYLRSINHIQNQRILASRRKQNVQLLIQSITFYFIWFILWSPNQIASQFVNSTSVTGIATSLLNYIEIVLDPIIISALDVRFFKAWKRTYFKLKTFRQIRPILSLTNYQR